MREPIVQPDSVVDGFLTYSFLETRRMPLIRAHVRACVIVSGRYIQSNDSRVRE